MFKKHFGMILVLYGLFKLVLGILALTLTLEYREKLQSIIIIKDFITLDLTAAVDSLTLQSLYLHSILLSEV